MHLGQDVGYETRERPWAEPRWKVRKDVRRVVMVMKETWWCLENGESVGVQCRPGCQCECQYRRGMLRRRSHFHHPLLTGTGGAGVLGRKLVLVVDAGVLGRLRIFCHQCRCEFIVVGSAAMPGSKLDVSLVLPTKLPLPTLLSTERLPSASDAASSNDCGDRVFARSEGDVGGA